jgi:hypothetical protein
MRGALIILMFVHLPVFIYGQVNSFFWDTTYSNEFTPEMCITHDSNNIYFVGQKAVGSIVNDFVIGRSFINGQGRMLNEYSIPRGLVLQNELIIWNNKLVALGSGRDSGAVSTHFTYLDKQTLGIDSSHIIHDSLNTLGLYAFGPNIAYPLPDSSLIIAGMQFIDSTGNNTKAIAFCVDSKHNIKWITQYQPNLNNSYFFLDIDSLSTGQLIISGLSKNNQIESPFYAFLNKDNGNITKSKIWQNAGYISETGGLAVTPENQIIIGASEVEYYQGLDPYSYPKIACFDTNGFKIWETKIDQSNPRAGYYPDQIDYMNDSTILLKCAFLSDQGELQSSLTKFSLAGDSLWTKYINHPGNSSLLYTGIDEFLELPNKDIVYCGYYGSSNKGDQSFVARVNKHGCFYGADWCYDTPIIPNFDDVGISNKKDKRVKMEIWPNPANDYISLNNRTNARVQLTIVDMNGKKLYNENMGKGLNEIQIDFLSPGVYILEMCSSNQLIDQQKLIVK